MKISIMDLSRGARPALLALVFGGVSNAAADEQPFKLFLCGATEEPSAVLVFRNGEGRARRTAFMGDYREFAITLPDGKGLLKWDKVIAVRTLPIAPAHDMAGLMRIEYRDHDGIKSLELGVIDEACLADLKKRYGAQLNFQPS